MKIGVFIKKVIIKCYTWRLRRRFRAVGRNVTFQPAMKLINPRHVTIGDGCFFGPGCRIEAWDRYGERQYDPTIEIGNAVRVNSTCHIGAINRIVIGDSCLLGSHVFITDHAHGRFTPDDVMIHPSDRELYSKGEVVIGERCWLCENVTVLPGVHIGKGCVIGAGSVVTRDVPDYSMAAGNPARVVRRLEV